MAGAGLLCSCGRARDPLLTYYNAEHSVSVRHPWHWSGESHVQDGLWSRTFRSPDAADGGPLLVTLVVGPSPGTLEQFAEPYLAGQSAPASAPEERPGARGRSWRYDAADGRAHALLLLQEHPPAPGPLVYGLHAEGPRGSFERHGALLAEMAGSLSIERPERYAEVRDERFGYRLRVPPSWREVRHLSGAEQTLRQFVSPALAAEKNRQTIHATLTVAAVRLQPGTTQEAFYDDTRLKLGDAFELLSHVPWRAGFADVLRAETAMAATRQRRYYAVAGGRGYTLTFEVRDDAYPRVARWCDRIADTFQTAASAAP